MRHSAISAGRRQGRIRADECKERSIRNRIFKRQVPDTAVRSVAERSLRIRSWSFGIVQNATERMNTARIIFFGTSISNRKKGYRKWKRNRSYQRKNSKRSQRPIRRLFISMMKKLSERTQGKLNRLLPGIRDLGSTLP